MRSLWKQKWAKGAVILCAIVAVIAVLMVRRIPLKLRYEAEDKELVLSPGFLYALDGYQESAIALGDILTPLSTAPPEYRFRCIPGGTAEEEFVVTYRSFTGREDTALFQVERIGGTNTIIVRQWNGPITLSFLCY